MFAGHQRRARGGADAGGRVSLREAQAFAGQAVELRCLVQVGTVTSEVGPAQIVGEDEEDVGSERLRREAALSVPEGEGAEDDEHPAAAQRWAGQGIHFSNSASIFNSCSGEAA